MALRTFYLRYLNNYSNQIHRDIELQAFRNGKPVYSHFLSFTEAKLRFPEIFKEPDLHRSILPNELLLDIDEESLIKNIAAAKLIANRLRKLGVPFWLFYSGNRSLHFSIFLEPCEIPPELDRRMEKLNFSWYDFRVYLSWRLLGAIKRSFDIDDLRLKQRRGLIRVCGSLNPKGGFYKVFLGTDDVLPTSLKEFKKFQLKNGSLSNEHFPEEIIEWPAKKWLPYLQDYLRYLEKKPKPKLPAKKGKARPMPCLDYLLSHKLPDGRKRTVNLAAMRLKYSMSQDELLDKLLEWNRIYQDNHLPSSYIRSQVRYAYHYKGSLGCKFARGILQDLGLDLCKECLRQIESTQWTKEELEAFPELAKYDPKYFILPKDRQLYLGIFNGVSGILSAFESRKYKTIRAMKKSSPALVNQSLGGL